MQTTPNYGFPYAEGTDPRRNFPATVNQPATLAIDTALHEVATKWEGLFFDQALTGIIFDSVISGPKTYQHTFTAPFTDAPIVLLSWYEGQFGFAYLSSATASSMVVGVRPAGTSTIPRVRWVALGAGA